MEQREQRRGISKGRVLLSLGILIALTLGPCYLRNRENPSTAPPPARPPTEVYAGPRPRPPIPDRYGTEPTVTDTVYVLPLIDLDNLGTYHPDSLKGWL